MGNKAETGRGELSTICTICLKQTMRNMDVESSQVVEQVCKGEVASGGHSHPWSIWTCCQLSQRLPHPLSSLDQRRWESHLDTHVQRGAGGTRPEEAHAWSSGCVELLTQA